jgi:hypothetical protein
MEISWKASAVCGAKHNTAGGESPARWNQGARSPWHLPSERPLAGTPEATIPFEVCQSLGEPPPLPLPARCRPGWLQSPHARHAHHIARAHPTPGMLVPCAVQPPDHPCLGLIQLPAGPLLGDIAGSTSASTCTSKPSLPVTSLPMIPESYEDFGQIRWRSYAVAMIRLLARR